MCLEHGHLQKSFVWSVLCTWISSPFFLSFFFVHPFAHVKQDMGWGGLGGVGGWGCDDVPCASTHVRCYATLFLFFFVHPFAHVKQDMGWGGLGGVGGWGCDDVPCASTQDATPACGGPLPRLVMLDLDYKQVCFFNKMPLNMTLHIIE